jgi:protein tyrosine phosphatase
MSCIIIYTHAYTLQDGSTLPVKQFQYKDWPEEGVPDTSGGLLDLMEQVQRWQRNSNRLIVVHCSGGTGRTGTFLAISNLLERLKSEGVVDVFHTVRALRLQRRGLVQIVVSFPYGMLCIILYR